MTKKLKNIEPTWSDLLLKKKRRGVYIPYSKASNSFDVLTLLHFLISDLLPFWFEEYLKYPENIFCRIQHVLVHIRSF